MGKLLIILGVILIIAGLIIHFFDGLPFLGKLPGDINIRKENYSFHFPIASSIVISLLIMFILFLVNKFR